MKDFPGDGDNDGSLDRSAPVKLVAVYNDGIGGTGGGGDSTRGGTFSLFGVRFSLSDAATEFQFQSRLKSRLLTCNLGSRGGGEEQDRGRENAGIVKLYICLACVPKQ